MTKTSFYAAVFMMLNLPAAAQDFVYGPINPSFGGSPLGSQHLLATANAQRTATASDAPNQNDINLNESVGRTDAELFLSQLQGRLLSQLAASVTEAIFGGDSTQSNGEVVFGDTKITFNRSLTAIELTIFDGFTTTQIVVPQLVVN